MLKWTEGFFVSYQIISCQTEQENGISSEMDTQYQVDV